MQEDSQTSYEQYNLICTELWFALRAFGEFGYLLIDPSVDMSKLIPQLTQRKYKKSGAKTKVEPKTDFITRGFASPDEADSLTLLVHAVRKGSAMIPSMQGGDPEETSEEDAWYNQYPGGTRIDPSNMTEVLSYDASQY